MNLGAWGWGQSPGAASPEPSPWLGEQQREGQVGAGRAAGGGGGGGQGGEALGCCLRTCWSCPVPPRVPPETKRGDIFQDMREAGRSPELREAFGEGQLVAGAAEGDSVSAPPRP